MSNSHHLHSSETIDPALTLPLRGWDPEGGIAVSHGKISVPKGTGLGVNPSPDHLGTPIASYG